MENNEKVVAPKEYKEERFEFVIYSNDNIVCKRNFKIFNFIEGSMQTIDFKETMDDIVKMIDDDLKSKSRVYTWYYFNENSNDENDEFKKPLIEPWEVTLKISVFDNKKEIFSKIWDGRYYQKFIRDRIDLGNKTVRVINKDGQVTVYDKEKYFEINKDRLTPEMYALKAMIFDKQDVLLQITKKICEACSPSRDEMKDIPEGNSRRKAVQQFLDGYVQQEEYHNVDADGNKTATKKYAYSLALANKEIEKAWEQKLAKKTKEYFDGLN